MKTFYLTFLFLGLTISAQCQKSLSDYSYIIVNDQFEFQDQKDKYQLNSLIKFLYNKHGFHAYFNKEVPQNVRRCDGLYADAEGKPGFRVTKVTHIIRDCNGNEVFRSKEGKSGHKEFKNAYYEAAREAFESISVLDVNQNKLEEYAAVSENQSEVKEIVTSKPETNEVSKPTVPSKPTSVVSVSASTKALSNLPAEKYSNYTYDNQSFLLRKTKDGYSLYQELQDAEEELQLIGKLSVQDNKLYFLEKNKKPILASFDDDKNLLIEFKKGLVTYRQVD